MNRSFSLSIKVTLGTIVLLTALLPFTQFFRKQEQTVQIEPEIQDFPEEVALFI
ncbi:MAG TPA: hypothetical protein PLO67_10560 [Saprospiraceae bacterium]|nr:hypothetical protein [Saprospiraceae bacterium]HPI06289.1 hypothetical protein [Saprospiraceae bacterium]